MSDLVETPQSSRLFFKIGEAAQILEVKPHVLRFWETEFPMLTPEKSDNGQRVYRRADVELLLLIQSLLYDDRYSIDGARKKLREYRRAGELKQRRMEAAKKRGFSADPAVRSFTQDSVTPAVAVGAELAGLPVPREVLQQSVNSGTAVIQKSNASSPSHAFLSEVSRLIDDIKSLQLALTRAPQSRV